MPDFNLTSEVMKQITTITNPHLKALNEDITPAFPQQPDMAFALAVGYGVSVLLGNLSDPAERANAAQGINIVLGHTGYILTPLS